MPITNKDLKKSKDLVEKLLKVNGEKYNDWLHTLHQQYIEDNQDLILQALSSFVGEDSSTNDDEIDLKENQAAKESNTTENVAAYKQTI